LAYHKSSSTSRIQAIRIIEEHALEIFREEFEDLARDFNSRQSNNGWLRMHMSIPQSTGSYYISPIEAQEEMTLKVKCESCKSRYAIIGSGFFCPICGHNSAEETFDESIKKIELKLKHGPLIRKTIEQGSKDEAQIVYRSLIEASLNESVVAFQRYCEASYYRVSPLEKVRPNAFQNLEIGGEYWKKLLGESYTDWLSEREMTELNTLFQKRHLFSHTEGIVDKKYLEKTKDKNYIERQRIVLHENDIHLMIKLVRKIINEIRQKLENHRRMN
jgi:hypothetical protein